MAAPAFRSTSNDVGVGASRTPAEPTGAASGDIFVAIAYIESNSATFTPPTGWSSSFNGSTVDSGVMSDGPWEAHAFWIRRGGSAPDLTFNFGVSAYGEVNIYAYSGAVSSGDPFSFGAATVRNDTTAKNFPDISGTTTTADELLLWFGESFGFSTPNVPTSPGTWTSRGGTGDVLGADQAQAVAGATGTVTGGISNQGTNQATASFLFGLQSVAAGGGLAGKGGTASSGYGTLTIDSSLSGKGATASSGRAYLNRGTGGYWLMEDGTSKWLMEDGTSFWLLEDTLPPVAGALAGKGSTASSGYGTLSVAKSIAGKGSTASSGKGTLTVSSGFAGKGSTASSGKATIAVSPPYDDFPGSSIDLNQWTVYNRLGDQVNSEVNAVIPANVRVSSGTLKIDSKFEDVVAGDTTTGAPNPRTVHYTSGQIAQSGVPFLYGTVDVRAKLPAAAGGAWPCIWMLGYEWQASQPYTANVVGADWPNGGWWEIDIAEFLGGHRTQVNNALHFITANRAGSGEKTLGFDASTQFAVYRLVWTPTSLTWYVDAEGGAGFVQTLQITGTAGTDIPNTPGYLIIHTAIGGPGGTPVSTDYPITFEVDYARVTLAGSATPISASDTLNITLTETRTLLGRSTRTDALNVAVSEARTLLARSTSTDTLNVSVTDTSASKWASIRTDALNVTLTDTSSPTATVARTDALNITLTEAQTSLWRSTRTDALNITLTEAQSSKWLSTLTDTLSVTLTDSSAVKAQRTTTDALNVTLTESSSVTQGISSKSGVDALNITLTDSSASKLYSTSTDTLSITVVDTSSSKWTSTRTDALSITIADASTLFSGTNITRTDTLSVSVTEARNSKWVSTRTDTVNVTLADTSSSKLLSTRTDALGITLTDLSAVTAQRPTTDTLNVALAEGRAIANPMAATDALSVTLTTETRAILARSTRTDSLVVALTELQSSKWFSTRTDTLSVHITDVGGFMQALSRFDTINLTVTELANPAVLIARGDLLNVGVGDNALTIFARSTRTDTLNVFVLDTTTSAISRSAFDQLLVTLTEAQHTGIFAGLGTTKVFHNGAWRTVRVYRWNGAHWVTDLRIKAYDRGVNAWVPMNPS